MPNVHAAAGGHEIPPERGAHHRMLVQLGHGGMARVFLAVRIGTAGFRRLCVLKRMQDHLLQNEEFLRMFLREARLAARLNHPNIVSTEEVGHDLHGHFIAMEYLEGQSYLALLNKVKRDKLDFTLSVRVLIEVLRGLEYAHGMEDFDGTPMQIVHRDLSPGNIVITYDGRIKILDFGIAKVLDSRGETQTGVLKGKLSYMAPEQVRGQPVSIRADLYAVGVLLWEAAAGRRRWENLPEASVLRYLISGKVPEPPHAAQRGLPESVDRICLKALAIEPAERFQSARELRLALESVLEEIGRNPSADSVGEAVAHHFKEERDRLRSEIESLLKRLQNEESISISWQSQTAIDKQMAAFDAQPNSGSRRIHETAIQPVTQLRSPDPPAHNPRSHRGLVVGLGAATFLVAGLLVGRTLVPKGEQVLAHTAEPTHVSEAAPPPAPKPVESLVRFQIAASPENAAIYANGKRLPSNPSRVEVGHSSKLEVRVEAPGYVTESRLVTVVADGSIEFALQRLVAKEEASEQPASAPVPGPVARSHVPRAARPTRPAPSAAVQPPAPASEADDLVPITSTVSEPNRRTKRPGVALDSEDPWQP